MNRLKLLKKFLRECPRKDMKGQRELKFLLDIELRREKILSLLVKDSSHDALIERPELYSIEADIEQWMYETRETWNERLPKLMEQYRKEGEELKGEEPEYYEKYEARYYTEAYIRHRAFERYRRERGRKRSHFHGVLAHFWRALLKKRPEFANRCPWHSFRGDNIWMALQDEAFCKAVGLPKKELALKMPLKIMSTCDWEELLKTVPELQPDYDKLVAAGYRFEAYCI